MQLFFVADGPRDRATIPEIVKGILNAPVEVEFREWKKLRIHGGGYRRKLRIALLQARDQDVDGVVATVDSDKTKPGERLSMLRAARDEDRQNPSAAPIPAAVGEAVPHLEAWLLDDPKAVRDVLRFSTGKSIPRVRQSNPKADLNALIDECVRTEAPVDLLHEIARNIDIKRSNHSSETGFDEFVHDIRAELGPLVSAAS